MQSVKHPPSEELLTTALHYMARAYAPYSKFQVGSALLTDHGKIFGGCNIENASYSLSLCAESNAICTTMAERVCKIAEIVVMTNTPTPTAPCGACRERISEFATPDTLIHLCTEAGQIETYTFAELYPLPFDRSQLDLCK